MVTGRSPSPRTGTSGSPAPQESFRCSGCSGPLPVESVDRATWTVRCTACGRVEDLSRIRPETAAALEPPAGVAERAVPGGLELSWRGVTGSQVFPRLAVTAVAGTSWTILLLYFPVAPGIFFSLFMVPLLFVMVVPVILKRYLRDDGAAVVVGFLGLGRVWGAVVPRSQALRAEIGGVPPRLSVVLRDGRRVLLEREYLVAEEGSGVRYLARRINDSLGPQPSA